MLVKCHCGEVRQTYAHLAMHVYYTHHQLNDTHSYVNNCPWCGSFVASKGPCGFLKDDFINAYARHCRACSKYKLFQLFGALQQRNSNGPS